MHTITKWLYKMHYKVKRYANGLGSTRRYGICTHNNVHDLEICHQKMFNKTICIMWKTRAYMVKLIAKSKIIKMPRIHCLNNHTRPLKTLPLRKQSKGWFSNFFLKLTTLPLLTHSWVNLFPGAIVLWANENLYALHWGVRPTLSLKGCPLVRWSVSKAKSSSTFTSTSLLIILNINIRSVLMRLSSKDCKLHFSNRSK